MTPKKMSKKNNPGDNLYTPDYATEMIHQFTPEEWKIWEPACGTGNIVKYYQKQNYNIIGTDKETGQDFFKHTESCDCIITNPPYSIKTEWIERCLQLNKPFALLLPVSALGCNDRSKLWSQVDVELLIPNKRIEFMGDTKSNIHFDTVWFCVGFCIRQITGYTNNFMKINKPKRMTTNQLNLF